MKAKVLIGFRDKHNGKRYHPGEVIEVTEKRLKEILGKGKLVAQMEDAKTGEEPKEDAPNENGPAAEGPEPEEKVEEPVKTKRRKKAE